MDEASSLRYSTENDQPCTGRSGRLSRLSIGLALTIGLTALPIWARADDSYVFASGPESGVYLQLAKELAREAEEACSRCPIMVIPTQGSYDNASRLRSRAVDIALIQSDVAYLEHFEGRPYQAIASLYTEPIHIVARRELGLARLSELLNSPETFRISIGTEGSGTASNALTLLQELDAPPGHFETYQYGLNQSLEKLRARELDGLFLTAPPPTPVLLGPAGRKTITLLEVDADIARRLLKKYPFFSLTEIPYDAYEVRKRSIRTIGPETLLVVGDRPPPELIRALLDGLYRMAAEARDGQFRALARLTPETGLDGIPIPIHRTSESYHQEKASRLTRLLRSLQTFSLPLILILTCLLALARLSKVAYFVHQFVLGRILALLVAVWLLGSAAMHLIEGAKNSNFRSFGQSAIAILHYLFSGLEAKYPITLSGNIVAILILSLGVAVVTLFTATLVTVLVERLLNVRSLRLKPWSKLKLTGHVVLVGWSRRSERILAQLRSPDLTKQPPVVVVVPDRKQVQLRPGRRYRNAWLVEGDVAKCDTLKRADLEKANAALLLSSDSGDQCGDFPAISTTLAIETMAPPVRTIVEVQDDASVQHLRHCHVDEVVQLRALGERMLSQCVITPGVSRVFDELLTFQRGSQEIYGLELPPSLLDVSFRETQRALLGTSAIPIGLQRLVDGEVTTLLNPRSDGFGCPEGTTSPELRHARRLLVVADKPKLGGPRPWLSWLTRSRSPLVRSTSMEPSTTQTPLPAERSRDQVRVGICGWNDEARAVIDQLRQSVIASHHEFTITVICDPARETFRQTNGSYHERITFVVGDPTHRSVLQNAGIEAFDELVILGDRSPGSTSEHADHRSLMIALAAHDLQPRLHTVVEVRSSENREHFERLPNVEIVSIQEVSEKLLAQAAVSPGITGVFMELLTATEDSNEVYIVPVPDRWVGWSFQSIYSAVVESAEPILPLGYRVPHPKGDGRSVVVLNPEQQAKTRDEVVNWRGYQLQQDDHLVLIAYEEPSW